MMLKNTNDHAIQLREALDHLDEVRMPKESREALKVVRRTTALLLVQAVKETIDAPLCPEIHDEVQNLVRLVMGSDVQSLG